MSADETFDYVIVGAGSTGCVLANRLTEDGKTKVCLIEAGGADRHPFIHIPAAVGAILGNPNVQWGFWTEPQTHLNGRKLPTPRGKVLGGTGAINGMVYYRGQPEDYDDWSDAGCAGWSYSELLPYFIRSENNLDFGDAPWHGDSGPMGVSSIRDVNPLNDIYARAAGTLGIPRCDDFNAPGAHGVGLRQGAIRDGRRVTSATAFLRPALKRGNLNLVSEAQVRRVVIENGRATGVEIEPDDGPPRTIGARGEVVLCGGAYGSPHMLMLSGVGGGEQLSAHGIEVVADRPEVGRNLHDHIAAQIKVRTHDTRPYGVSWKTVPRGVWNLIEYALWRKGVLASHVFESHIVLKSKPDAPRPDLQFPFWTMLPNANLFPIPFGHGYAVSVVNNCPDSRGALTLTSGDPKDAPAIDPNIYSDPADMEPIVRGIHLARQILAAEPFAEFEGEELAPGPDVRTDDEIRAWLRDATATTFHPVGTCRMGGDADSVVDPELRVRGVNGLRVADASIFPAIMRGNTNAACVMTGEKAADMILGRPAPAPMDIGNMRVA